MGADGSVWVWWGIVLWTYKQTRQIKTLMGLQSMLSIHFWSGKFSPKVDIHEGKGGAQVGDDGFGWVQGDT